MKKMIPISMMALALSSAALVPVGVSADVINTNNGIQNSKKVSADTILYQTDFEQDSGIFSAKNTTHLVESGNGFLRIDGDTFAGATTFLNLEKGKKYTMECDVKSPDSGGAIYSFDMKDAMLASIIDPIPGFLATSNTWDHQSVTFTALSDSVGETYIDIKLVGGKVLDIDNFKLTMLE